MSLFYLNCLLVYFVIPYYSLVFIQNGEGYKTSHIFVTGEGQVIPLSPDGKAKYRNSNSNNGGGDNGSVNGSVTPVKETRSGNSSASKSVNSARGANGGGGMSTPTKSPTSKQLFRSPGNKDNCSLLHCFECIIVLNICASFSLTQLNH